MGKPPCPYFGKCGGCAFQDVDYDHQLADKKLRLNKEIGFENIQVFSGKPYFYRQRMDMVFHSNGIGLRKKGSWHRIVDIKRCIISNEELNGLIQEITDFFKEVDFFDVKKRKGSLRYAVMRTPPGDSSVSIVLNRESDQLTEAESVIQAFSEKTSSKNVLKTYVPFNTDRSVSEDYIVVKGQNHLKEDLLDKSFVYPVQGFFQNNHEMTERVHSFCHSLFEHYETSQSHLLDLYGGVGTFGLINARLFKTVTILENYEPAIKAAEKNILHNAVTNATTTLGDAKQLKTLDLPSPLFVIVDPPRSGIHPKTVKRLNEIEPELILYISCNIKQLGYDLEKLTKYKVKSAALFDLFPQTPHMEAVVELEKVIPEKSGIQA